MLTYFDLRKGVVFILDGQPYQVLDFLQMKKAQREGIAKTKLRNLITDQVIEKNFHQADTFEEAELEKVEAKFLYFHKGKYVFCDNENPKVRFELEKEKIGSAAKFLKPNTIVTGIKFQEKIINIVLAVKVQLEVIEAPPGVRGDRAQGGTKQVILETGVKVNVPLFIETGDIVEVNTETEEYTRRVE